MSSRSNGRNPLAMGSDTKRVPIGDALSRVGHELVHLAWLLENLQCHIRPFIQEAAAHDTNVLHQMQSFDHVGQIAHGLSDFLSALALDAPRLWIVDPSSAAQKVTLADLAARLGSTGEEENSCSTAWGDCDLF